MLILDVFKDLEIPKRCPKLVASSPDNVDMERLKKDIPKFLDNSRVISSENKRWWANFFAKENETYSSAEDVGDSQKTWLLDDLKVLKFGRAATCEDESILSTERAIKLETTPLVPVQNTSSEITDLVQSQFNDIPQVR